MIPAPACCPSCGSAKLSKLGEDVTETLEVIPRRWKVIQTVREKFSCRCCERAAFMTTLIMTAKLNDVDPLAWLADVLARIAGMPQSRLHELLPWEWKQPSLQKAA